jgi:transposase
MASQPLSDSYWSLIEPLIPKQHRGRPRSRNRERLDAIFYVLYTGCRWEELPPTFPPKSTVHKRLQVWQEAGFFDALFKHVKQLKKQLKQDIYLMDATIKSAKKGGLLSAERVKARAVRSR